jgi:hypothetical protein
VAVAVPLPREQLVFLVVLVRGVWRRVVDPADEIAEHHVDLVVRPEDDRVRPVFAVLGEVLEQLHVVELVGAFGVPATVQPVPAAGAGPHHVQAVEGVQEAHRLADREVEVLDLLDSPFGDRRAKDRLFVLAADEEPALVVLRQRNPRPFRGRVRRVQQFDLEAGERGQILRLGGGPLRWRAFGRGLGQRGADRDEERGEGREEARHDRLRRGREA